MSFGMLMLRAVAVTGLVMVLGQHMDLTPWEAAIVSGSLFALRVEGKS